MAGDYSQFEKRKQDHIELALMSSNQAEELNALDRIQLPHEALPDLNFSEIDIHSQRFGHRVLTPFMVSSMTAGHADAERINRHLLAACASSGWAMGVGSQRRELTDPSASAIWRELRQEFPHVSVFGNLGIAQLINTPIENIRRLCDELTAEAFIIHCNPLQECIQPEGTPEFKGCWDALEALVKQLALPIIIKETGCGFGPAALCRLHDIGVAAVDVSGLGGTHWGRIEGHRAQHEPMRYQAAETFRNWGITTVDSVKNAYALKPNFEIWGSGGVRHGLDAAKLIALGATTIGLAKCMLQAAVIDPASVLSAMHTIEYELRVAMFCTGSRTLANLKEKAC